MHGGDDGDDDRHAPPDPWARPCLSIAGPLLSAPRLVVTHDGVAHAVQGKMFIVGSDADACHLCIVEPGIARQHVTFECVGVEWSLLALQDEPALTSGGVRVLERRRLVDGDVFELAGHELRVALR